MSRELKNISNNKEIGVAVVVTYNRKEMLKKCIECLVKQSYQLDRIYIVNNASSDGTDTLLEEIVKTQKNIKYMNMEENCGGSGGFYKGIQWAFNEGADWIWGMDDDAFADEKALENLVKKRQLIGLKDAYWSNCNKDKNFVQGYKSVDEWMFVGFFLTKQIIESIGLPRRDFFIYYDDFEYAKRIKKAGYSIWKIEDSIISHKDASCCIKNIKIIGKDIEVVKLPKEKWKTYYLVRNDILMSKGEKNKAKILYRTSKRIVKAMLMEADKLGIVLIAVYHGIIGKTGKRISP